MKPILISLVCLFLIACASSHYVAGHAYITSGNLPAAGPSAVDRGLIPREFGGGGTDHMDYIDIEPAAGSVVRTSNARSARIPLIATRTLNALNNNIQAQLYKASMVFSVPDKANVDDVVKVQLLIDPSKTVEDLEREVTIKGVKTSKTIKISKIVSAALFAPTFEVTSITPTVQAIADDEPTEWRWNLAPKKAGKQEVSLTITAVVQVGETSTVRQIKTFDTTVEIEVTPQQVIVSWLKSYWQWLASTLIIPLGLWAFANRSRLFKFGS